jgi:hypothetical protein
MKRKKRLQPKKTSEEDLLGAGMKLPYQKV